MISAAQLVEFETCPRRYWWTLKYENLRVPLIRALYAALHAGLLAENPERAAEDKFLSLAASPGLDIEGHDVYAIAMHHAKLAGIVAAALRSTTTAPWTLFPATDTWESACYDMGEGKPRRIVLVDRWSESRKQEEIYGWRTMGEVCGLGQGSVCDGSHNWTIEGQKASLGMDSRLPSSAELRSPIQVEWRQAIQR